MQHESLFVIFQFFASQSRQVYNYTSQRSQTQTHVPINQKKLSVEIPCSDTSTLPCIEQIIFFGPLRIRWHSGWIVLTARPSMRKAYSEEIFRGLIFSLLYGRMIGKHVWVFHQHTRYHTLSTLALVFVSHILLSFATTPSPSPSFNKNLIPTADTCPRRALPNVHLSLAQRFHPPYIRFRYDHTCYFPRD